MNMLCDVNEVQKQDTEWLKPKGHRSDLGNPMKYIHELKCGKFYKKITMGGRDYWDK